MHPFEQYDIHKICEREVGDERTSLDTGVSTRMHSGFQSFYYRAETFVFRVYDALASEFSQVFIDLLLPFN